MNLPFERDKVGGCNAVAADFDGIVCFGGVDWWYHNRGHYCIQMMRNLSRRVPVLYVNSLGMKVHSPREGAMFLTRVRRKLRSFARGMVEVEPGFTVYSPLVAPAGGRIDQLGIAALRAQLRLAVRRCGMRRPLVWVACPRAAEVLDAFDGATVVYQRTDRFEAFAGVDRDRIAGYDRKLKEAASLVVFCARSLHEAERNQCHQSAFIDHGVDFGRFRAAAEAGDEPEDVRNIQRPRVGFVGGIDAHTFDPGLFVEVAQKTPEMQFVLVGGCSLPEGWCDLPNVHLLGQKPYDHVADYMAACDVLIMPWNRSEWIQHCNPVKMKEYLAVGKPVVTTPFPEAEYYRPHVRIVSTGAEFVASLRACVADRTDVAAARSAVMAHGWGNKADEVWLRLALPGPDSADAGNASTLPEGVEVLNTLLRG